MNQDNNKRMWLFTAALLVVGSISLNARRIDAGQAKSIANKFVSAHSPQFKAGKKIETKVAYAPTVQGEVALYVVNNSNNSGFTIVSGDDELTPVLGYSESGEFDYDKLPDNLKYWIDEYVRQIEYFYSTGNGSRIIVGRNTQVVKPLLSTTWTQRAPFNDQCPSSGGSHMPAGCSVIAAAQVMNYHKWPPKGVGTTPEGLDISTTEYRWDLMKDNYVGNESAESKNAVATLVYQIGSSFEVIYDPSGSGVYDCDLHRGLIENFNYNPGIKYILHDCMSDEDWDNNIYTELVKGRPVIMTGQAIGGGHCFVCDGYDGKGYYHMNWGWGGYQDGYYLLNALNPASGGTGSFDGGYNSGQTAFIDVIPAGIADTEPEYMLVAQGDLMISEDGKKIQFSNGSLLYNPTGHTITANLGFQLENVENPEITGKVNIRTIQKLGGFMGYDIFTLPEKINVEDGDYKATLWFTMKGQDPQKVLFPFGAIDYVMVTVKDGKAVAYSQVKSGGKVAISTFNGLNNIYASQINGVSATVTNISHISFKDNINVTVYDSSNKKVASASAAVSVSPASSKATSFTLPAIDKAGEYYLSFISGDQTLATKIPFNVKEALDYKADNESVKVDELIDHRFAIGESNNFKIKLRNSSNSSLYCAPQLYIYDKDMKAVTSTSLSTISIPRNDTKTVELNIYMPEVEAGTYFMAVKSDNYGNLSPLTPIYLYKANENTDFAYQVISENEKSVRIVAPHKGRYAGRFEVPEVIDNKYNKVEIDGGALCNVTTLESVKIPSSVTEIPSGLFYGRTINQLTIDSPVAPLLGQDAFDYENSKNTLIQLPEGAANLYARTSGWDKFNIPSWNIDVEDGIIISGLSENPETSTIYSPYYVSGNEALKIQVDGTEPRYAIVEISNGEKQIITSDNGEIQLPILGLNNGKCMIVKDFDGINPIFDTANNFDIYNLQGIKVVPDATTDDLKTLPKGIYIIGNQKMVIQ